LNSRIHKRAKPRRAKSAVPTPQTITPIVTLPAEGDGYLNLVTVLAVFQVKSPVSIWRWVKAGVFPTPVKLGSQLRWELSDLRAHMVKLRGGAA
jgi:predicted DNA-binding transcriptional regulator AlpA